MYQKPLFWRQFFGLRMLAHFYLNFCEFSFGPSDSTGLIPHYEGSKLTLARLVKYLRRSWQAMELFLLLLVTIILDIYSHYLSVGTLCFFLVF